MPTCEWKDSATLEGELSEQVTAAANQTALAAKILGRAACQLGALRAASAGMVLGPTLDDRVAMLERAREELLRIEHAEVAYAELTGEALLETAERRLERLPAPQTWRDVTVARLLVCLSAQIELEQTSEPGDSAGLASEVEHVNAARSALRDLGAASGASLGVSPGFVDAWRELALSALHDQTARARYAATIEHELPHAS